MKNCVFAYKSVKILTKTYGDLLGPIYDYEDIW
jgi:hypothetical protein